MAPTRSAAHGYWRAYTTIPETPDLAWLVLGHPDHGVSVYLVRNDDASALYSVIPQKAVTVRHGGYWWDGTNWYRPEVYNPARGTNDAIPVPDAEDLIGQPVEGTPLDIEEINAYPHHHDRINAWLQGRELTVPPRLDLIAEELRADSLLTSAESAERAGIAASTFRAYLARGENDIPHHSTSRPLGASTSGRLPSSTRGWRTAPETPAPWCRVSPWTRTSGSPRVSPESRSTRGR